MIAGGLAVATLIAGVLASRYGVERAVEVIKEFGGGFGAYWTHHVFHKIWHASGRRATRKGGRDAH